MYLSENNLYYFTRVEIKYFNLCLSVLFAVEKISIKLKAT